MKTPVYFRVGMKVYSLDYEDGQKPGIVTCIDGVNTYPIEVEFGGGTVHHYTEIFTFDGRNKPDSMVVLSQKKIQLIENEVLPSKGDAGYFWDNVEGVKNVRYGRLYDVIDGKYYGWNSNTSWDNFSVTPPKLVEI